MTPVWLSTCAGRHIPADCLNTRNGRQRLRVERLHSRLKAYATAGNFASISIILSSQVVRNNFEVAVATHHATPQEEPQNTLDAVLAQIERAINELEPAAPRSSNTLKFCNNGSKGYRPRADLMRTDKNRTEKDNRVTFRHT